MEYKELWLLFLSLVITISSIAEGVLHCHCNAPSCIATGYMCRSEQNQCYSLYSTNGPLTMASYGCMDTLNTQLKCSEPDVKNGENDPPKIRNKISRTTDNDVQKREDDVEKKEVAILLCCTDDMCNHLTERDVEVVKTLNYEGLRHDGELAPSHDGPENYYSSERDLWFKASVIGVPISGGFILLLLVLLAFRMLRNDKKRQNRILKLRTEQSLTKTQLYCQSHFYTKHKNNRTNHKHQHKEYCKVNVNDTIKVKSGNRDENRTNERRNEQNEPSLSDVIIAPGFESAPGSIV